MYLSFGLSFLILNVPTQREDITYRFKNRISSKSSKQKRKIIYFTPIPNIRRNS